MEKKFLPPAPGINPKLTARDCRIIEEDFRKEFRIIVKNIKREHGHDSGYKKFPVFADEPEERIAEMNRHLPPHLRVSPGGARMMVKPKKNINPKKAKECLDYLGLPDYFQKAYLSPLMIAKRVDAKRNLHDVILFAVLYDELNKRYNGEALRNLLRRNFVNKLSIYAMETILTNLFKREFDRTFGMHVIRDYLRKRRGKLPV